MTESKAFICGCAGPALSEAERAFLRRERPWGLILFRRNIEQHTQIKQLISDFWDCVGWPAPVLLDQEGGRVQRLGPPLWPAYPAASAFGRIEDRALAHEAVRLASRLIASDLYELGITIDCMPVLDVPARDGHAIIGDRAYHSSPARIADLAKGAVEGLIAGSVLPVIKHIPGHGRARADSHLELPVVESTREELEAVDFAPFRALASAPIAMTAHVVYTVIDDQRPATLSPKVVGDCIRGAIGFQGLLMTDDLSMRALAGPFRDRARSALEAGVDILLHCNGDLSEATEIAQASPVLAGASLARANAALRLIAQKPEPFDPAHGRERLREIMTAASS